MFLCLYFVYVFMCIVLCVSEGVLFLGILCMLLGDLCVCFMFV